jgi:hypothetical protein
MAMSLLFAAHEQFLAQPQLPLKINGVSRTVTGTYFIFWSSLSLAEPVSVISFWSQ